ncbi:MAG: type 1 glutamine amidotransferase [Actinomycetota bacterium]|nr:type 1 glutamine amidotransferase [Actinomycetota bacterium]
MRALAIVHQEDAGPGVFAEKLASQGVELEYWRVPEQPQMPADIHSFGAVMTFGGAMHIDQDDRHDWLAREKELLRELIERGTPLLGACLGAQLLCVAAGGEVSRMREPEIGWVDVEVSATDDPLVGPLAPRFSAFEWHSYACVPPSGSVVLARSEQCAQAFRIGEAAWGVQFHAEVSLTDAEHWIADWRSDEDALRVGLDAEALGAETAKAISAWNELGRGMAGRFLEAAATRA